MIIEDNSEIRENTTELLEINNYTVLAAESGNTGFALAKEFLPALIICDMLMPGTDGQAFFTIGKGRQKRKPYSSHLFLRRFHFTGASANFDQWRKCLFAKTFYRGRLAQVNSYGVTSKIEHDQLKQEVVKYNIVFHFYRKNRQCFCHCLQR